MASTTGSTMANITVTTERKSKRRCKQEGGRIMYKKKYSGWLKHADFLILDIIVLQLSFYVAYCIRHGIGNMYADQLYAGMAIVLLLIDIVIGIIFENLHNVMKRGFWIEAIQTSKQVLEVFALFAIYLVTVQSAEQFSRTVLYLTMVFYWILSYVGRILWKTYLKHHNRYAPKRSLIIVTKADRLPILTEQLQGETYASYQILGITVVDADMMGQQIGNYTVIANADSIIEYTRTGWVDEIYIDLEPGDASAEPLVRQFLEMGTVTHVRVPDALTESGRKIIMEKLGDMPVITATMNYASPRQLFMKRCLDVTGGLIGCILTGILCIFLAPAIYIQSPGPIFFSQIRVGKNGKQFRLYKFRSMYMDAEERKAEELYLSTYNTDAEHITLVAQIFNRNKEFILNNAEKKVQTGAWVDILVIDGAPEKGVKRKLFEVKYMYYRMLNQFAHFSEIVNLNKKRPWYENIAIRFAQITHIEKYLDPIKIGDKFHQLLKTNLYET